MNGRNSLLRAMKWIWDLNLILKICVGLVVGIVLALVAPGWTVISVFGDLFVTALKSVAPVLVLALVTSALANTAPGTKTNMKSVIGLYVLGTFLAGVVAVTFSFMFPVTLQLTVAPDQEIQPPSGITEVLGTLLHSIVANPVDALLNANYIGILAWGIALGILLKRASAKTKEVFTDLANALGKLVRIVVEFAPLGVMGLVFTAIAVNGLGALADYARVIILLVASFAVVVFVLNPIIVAIAIRKNPYPLIFTTLRESAVPAFFTRSSAANIPVNMQLARKLGLNPATYSVSIPLGATINMAGAAVTISMLTLAAVHTLEIPVDFPSALLLCIISAVGAAGASGVAGGSLLLIPLACNLFSIPTDIAMQVVGVGFIIGVIQDSCETAINSSTDVLYTATAEFAWRRRHPEEYQAELAAAAAASGASNANN